MSMFLCDGCDQYLDSDYFGFNTLENGDGMDYCDECWFDLCEQQEEGVE